MRGYQAMPPQDDPNATVVNIRLGRAQFYSGLGAIVFAFLSLIYVIYGGMKDDIKELKGSIKTLSDSYQEAVTSGIKVQDLITKAPMLEKTINEMHDAVIKLQDSMDLLKPLPQQTQKIETNQEKMQIQLDNIQKQIHK
jgi:hypothetical protein